MEIRLAEKKENENNREYAYRVLRDNIMKLVLVPGTALNEGELAELFHMSRTPVHEAVLTLKEESLVDVLPQSGSKISYIDLNIMKEGYFMRSVMEPMIIKPLAGNMLKEYTQRLQKNLEKQREVLSQKDSIDAFFKLDDKFHQIIYEAGEKRQVWEAVKRVCTHYDRIRYLDAILSDTDLNHICKEHEKLYHLLLIGYADDFDLQQYYENHLGTYKKNFRKIVEENPQYFGI